MACHGASTSTDSQSGSLHYADWRPVCLQPGAAETSAFHYNAAVNACATSGLWQSALDLLLLGVKKKESCPILLNIFLEDGGRMVGLYLSSVIPCHCSLAAGKHKGHTRHDSKKI